MKSSLVQKLRQVAESSIFYWSMLVVTVAWTAYVFWPGSMSEDSFYILKQARQFEFSDGHPPTLALLWHYVDRWIPGPQGLMTLNLGAFYLGLWLILDLTMMKSWRKPLYALAIGHAPPVFGIMGAMWADIFMASAFMLVLALTLKFRQTKGLAAALLCGFGALLFISLAISLRHNAAAAAIPILGLLIYSLLERFWLRPSWLLTASLICVCLMGQMYAIKSWQAPLISKPRHLWQFIPIYDIAGISVRSDKNLFFEPLQKQSLDDLKLLYTTRSAIPILSGETIHSSPVKYAPLNGGYDTEEQRALLVKNWISAVLQHPFSYLSHRWFVFMELVGHTKHGLWGPVYGVVVKSELGVQQKSEHAYLLWLGKLSGKPFFKPKNYLLCLILCLAFCWRWRLREPLAWTLIFSGLFHVLGLALTAMSPDFRYTHWMTICALITMSLLTERRLTVLRNAELD